MAQQLMELEGTAYSFKGSTTNDLNSQNIQSFQDTTESTKPDNLFINTEDDTKDNVLGDNKKVKNKFISDLNSITDSSEISSNSMNLKKQTFSKRDKLLRKRENLSPSLHSNERKKVCFKQAVVDKVNKSLTSKIHSDSKIDADIRKEDVIANSDLNDVYKDILYDSIQNLQKPEFTHQELKRLRRKDLEDIIMQQVVTTLLSDCHIGDQKNLCRRLEKNLEYAQKKIVQLKREINDLKRVTLKLADEHACRRLELVNPVVIKRSVCVQAEPRYIDYDYEAESSSEEITFIAPKPAQRRKNTTHKNKTSQELRSKHLRTEEQENWSDMDDRNGYESLMDDSDTDEREEVYKQKLSQYNMMYKNGIKIPRPTLSAKQKNSSIVLTWNTPLSTCQDIASFRLFSCQNEKMKSKKRWKKIGDVEPMELPMACTLTDFHPEKTYHFAVRAINFKGESGPMSKSEAVFMS